MEVKILNKNVDASEGSYSGFANPFDEQPQEQPALGQELQQEIAQAMPQEVITPEAAVEQPIVQPEVVAQPVVETPKEPIDYWKELGIDDDGKKILEAYKQGKLDEFVSIKNTNYDNMSDEEILRLDIAQKYPNLSKEKLDVLYNKKLSSYGLTDEYDEDAIAIGKIQLEAEMSSVREGLKTKQSEYQIAEYKVPNQVNQEQERARQQEFTNYINSLPDFQKFEKDRSVKFGEVNFVVPNELDLKRATVDPEFYFSGFMNPDKSIKSEKWIKAWTYANNAEMVEKALIDYGKSLGRKESDEALRNPSSRNAQGETLATQPAIKIKGWVNYG